MRIWKFALGIIVFAILLGFFLYFENNSVVVTHLEIKDEKVPAEFDGFKILHLSDLHSKSFGQNQHTLVDMIKENRPDIIAFTGDLVDREHYDDEAGITLLGQAAKVAPVYYVTGNHEWWAGRFDELEPKLVKAGVNVLRDENISIKVEDQSIQIVGIDDIAGSNGAAAWHERLEVGSDKAVRSDLDKALEGLRAGDFKILLAHRPEHVSTYSSYPINLVLCGHAHGGQVRLPFVGGLIAPDQGFFPKYTTGAHKLGDTTMVVNRGLGNSVVPQRIFNRPEIIIVTLKR
ncbi:MAG: metallophosphoesterase [Candidatus Aquicultor sp.]|nr:metallophosphoesterase [Candidatus Aquicultor sp.]